MNKIFYFEFLKSGDIELARRIAQDLTNFLGINVYPSLGLASNHIICHSGVYTEVEINSPEEEENFDKKIRNRIWEEHHQGTFSFSGERPSADHYNAYPLTVFDTTIENIGDTWYTLNKNATKNIENGYPFSCFIYEKNGNVEVSGTIVSRSDIRNWSNKNYVKKLHTEFPNSKIWKN